MKVSASRRIFILLAALAVTATLFVTLPRRTSAVKGLFTSTSSQDAELPNYDIRTDKNAGKAIADYHTAASSLSVPSGKIRERAYRAGQDLGEKIKSLKIVYNSDIGIPEVIGSDVTKGFETLAVTESGKNADTLKRFLAENSNLFGISAANIDTLKTAADYTNPSGDLSFVELEQEINGIPVFRGEVKAGFTKSGEMFRVINNLAPGIDQGNVPTDFGDSMNAVRAAAANLKIDHSTLDLNRNEAASTNIKEIFGKGDSATTAEKMYFPIDAGLAAAAWRVTIWQPVNAFYIIVDAANGNILWRKNLTADQTQSATYNVYANPNAMMLTADNPFPITPGPVTLSGVQGSPLARTNVTLIGNEAPNTFNSKGWITDGGNVTDGNAVQAGMDRDTTDGIDTNSEAQGASRVFSYTFTPYNTNTNTGDAPLPTTQTYPTSQFQQGSATQMFYIANRYHDALYRLGFTEAARNFQDDNFGRGGSGGDRVRAEGQDSSGTNNANFSTPADGSRGRMQMYVWTGPNPDIDGDFDAEVMIHELTHGTSNRLHGNASGLSINMSSGMGEGWGDFYAHALLSEPGDPINGIYTIGSYDTYFTNGSFVTNSYYGIRRFPKAVKAFTGGPNNRPHNPLTFADIDATKIDLTDGAYARGLYGSSSADQVHNIGEVWSSALWEVRCLYVQRLGWAEGNRRVLQVVTDGMKLAPLAPTFLTERDAIIAAAQAGSPTPAADIADIWQGFATRGVGANASIQNPGTSSGSGTTRVTESFDLPNLTQTQNVSVTEVNGNGNGFPDPGEMVSVTIPVTNMTGRTATGVSVTISGVSSAVDYGTINHDQTISRNFTFVLPLSQACGGTFAMPIVISSSLGTVNQTRKFTVGSPANTGSENFDAVSVPNFPAGWTAVSVSSGINFVTSSAASSSAPNSAFAQEPSSVGGGTDLTSPSYSITASAAQMSFRHSYNTEGGWDGGVLEISIGGGAFQDILAAGGEFLEGGYDSTLGANSTNNPLSGRAAWSGDSGGFKTTVVRLPAAAAGQNVQFKWRLGSDDNTASVGWFVDTVQVSGQYNCAAPTSSGAKRADFDGDGKTDLSVFRSTAGDWYVQRSTAGFWATHFGTSGDVITPSDYDGDGKTDIAIFRPASGLWAVFNSGASTVTLASFGTNGDIPQAADMDGDGRSEMTVFRPSTGVWYWNSTSTGAFNAFNFGTNGDKPVISDYDGDHKADPAVFRPSTGTWYVWRSATASLYAVGFGLISDMPVNADYDRDGKADIAVWRPSNGTWYWLRSGDSQFSAMSFGISGDIPVPGDYDGDGSYDQAVYRSGTWYIMGSTSGFQAASFGLSADTPAPKGYIP